MYGLDEYQEEIDNVMESQPGASPDAKLIALAILNAGAFIAIHVERSAMDDVGETIGQKIGEIAGSLAAIENGGITTYGGGG